jgi:hypothetical protein
MRRIAVVALSVVLAVSLASCTFIQNGMGGEGAVGRTIHGSEGDIADACFDEVLAAIDSADKDGIKSLFSKKALAEAADIDAGIDYLFNLIQGDFVSWERTRLGSGDSVRDGKVSAHILSWYSLTTTEDTYLFFFWNYNEDTIDPDNQGLYTLRAIKAEDETEQFVYLMSMKIPGVYIPQVVLTKEEIADARFEAVLTTIKGADKDGIKALFSKNALANSTRLETGIGDLFNLIRGDVISWERTRLESDEYVRYVMESRTIQSWYSLTTTEDTYLFFLEDNETDLRDPDNQGLHALRAFTAEDQAEQSTYWQIMKVPGVYVLPVIGAYQ